MNGEGVVIVLRLCEWEQRRGDIPSRYMHDRFACRVCHGALEQLRVGVVCENPAVHRCRAPERLERVDSRYRIKPSCAQRELAPIRTDVDYGIQPQSGKDGIVFSGREHARTQQCGPIFTDPQYAQNLGYDVQGGGDVVSNNSSSTSADGDWRGRLIAGRDSSPRRRLPALELLGGRVAGDRYAYAGTTVASLAEYVAL
jgi:hypothetical protein